MQFKFFDILSSLIPGMLALIVVIPTYLLLSDNLEFFELKIKIYKDLSGILTLVFIVISFLTGYLINAIGSWSESVLFFLWRGRPTQLLLKNKNSKVFIVKSKEILEFLKEKSGQKEVEDLNWKKIFQVAKNATYINANDKLLKRVSAFNESYIFSRSILVSYTLCLGALCFLWYKGFIMNWFLFLFFVVGIAFFKRCKDRAIYYSREILIGAYFYKKKE